MRLRADPAVRADALVVLAAFLLLGVVAGVLWWMLADPAVYTKTAEGVEMGEVELTRRFGVDGWYAVIAGVAGFLAGLGLTWWRSRDLRLTTALVLVGSVLAAAVMASVGRLLGPGDPERALAAATRGDLVPVRLEVFADSAYLVWPIAGLAGALMVLWSTPRPGARELAEESRSTEEPGEPAGSRSAPRGTGAQDGPFRAPSPR